MRSSAAAGLRPSRRASAEFRYHRQPEDTKWASLSVPKRMPSTSMVGEFGSQGADVDQTVVAVQVVQAVLELLCRSAGTRDSQRGPEGPPPRGSGTSRSADAGVARPPHRCQLDRPPGRELTSAAAASSSRLTLAVEQLGRVLELSPPRVVLVSLEAPGVELRSRVRERAA